MTQNFFQQRVLSDLGLSEEEIRGPLRPNEKRIAGMYAASTDQLRWETLTRAMTIVERATRGDGGLAISSLLTFGRALWEEAGNEPFDAEFLHDADLAIQTRTRDIIREMMLPKSGMEAARSPTNFIRAMELNRGGHPVSFELMPHTSELDPVIVETILEDIARDNKGTLAPYAHEFLDKDLMIVGHKVFLSRMRRVFARTMRTLFMVAPKYRAGLQGEEKDIVTAHSEAVGKIAERIRSSANHVLLLCPEGGRTVNNQIGFHKALVKKTPGYHVPMFLEMPHNFLGLDATTTEAMRPARVRLYVGEPFDMQDGAGDFLHVLQKDLRATGAPVEKFAWGYKTMNRRAQGIERQKGAPEAFTEVIARKVS